MGLAIQVADGTIHPAALKGLGLTLGFGSVAVFAPFLRRWGPIGEGSLLGLLLVALALQLQCWFSYEAGQHLLISEPFRYAPLYLGLSLETLFAGLALASQERARRLFMIPLLIVFVALGLWLMRVTPTPPFDVWVYQNESARALLHGENPFKLTFPNPFGTDAYFGPGLATNERILYGFPYPPMCLYFSTLGYLLGDPRYAHLLCTVLSAGLMAFGQRGRTAAAGTILFVLTPRILEIIQLAWTEPTLVFLLALTVFCAVHRPRAVPYVFGCLLVAKQYTFFLLLLAPLITPLRGRELGLFLLRTVATGLAVTLPFVLLDPGAFFFSVVKIHYLQRFRVESLSYAAWWVGRGHPQPPSWLAFAVTTATAGLCAWRAPRTPAAFAAASGLVCCAFFALGKQAFVNYYYFVVAAFCIALAACRSEHRDAQTD